MNSMNRIRFTFFLRSWIHYYEKLMNGKKDQSSTHEKCSKSGSTSVIDDADQPISKSDEYSPSTICSIQKELTDEFKLLQVKNEDDDDEVLKSLDFNGLIEFWNETGFKNIITMVGAGISTSAGIPDFRSPMTGLYHNLQKYKLPYPTAIFELDYFRGDPDPFFALAKELYPGSFKPTICHYFIKLLHDKGLLLRHYTQNIDTLERIAGIPEEKLVEAHGTFHTNHCIDCNREYCMEWAKKQIFDGNVPRCTKCFSVVKPDIVFFGENLPNKFYILPEIDFKQCDLLIIMGTSLEVQPFASLVGKTNNKCVRLLINRELVGNTPRFDLLSENDKLMFEKDNNKRDIAWLGNCDDGVLELAEKVGLGDELKQLIFTEHGKLESAAELDAANKDKCNT